MQGRYRQCFVALLGILIGALGPNTPCAQECDYQVLGASWSPHPHPDSIYVVFSIGVSDPGLVAPAEVQYSMDVEIRFNGVPMEPNHPLTLDRRWETNLCIGSCVPVGCRREEWDYKGRTISQEAICARRPVDNACGCPPLGTPVAHEKPVPKPPSPGTIEIEIVPLDLGGCTPVNPGNDRRSFAYPGLPERFDLTDDTEGGGTNEAAEFKATAAPVAAQDTLWISESDFDPCGAEGWIASGMGGLGGAPAARLLSHLTDNDKCTENTTCAWLFSNPAVPACLPHLGFGPSGDVVAPGIDDDLTGPLVSLAAVPGAFGTVMSYRLFPGNNYAGARIALNWSVRSVVGGVFTPWQHATQYSTLSRWSWETQVADLTPFVVAGASDLQVRFHIADLGPGGLLCASAGSECGPGPGPYLDRIRIGRHVLAGPAFEVGGDRRWQPQDCFPADLNGLMPGEHYSPTTSRFGTCPFSAGPDEATCGASPELYTADAIRNRVVDANGTGGIAAVVWYGAIVRGPHAGKAPAPYAVGANGFFEVAAGLVAPDEYAVDLDDTYFRGGDVLHSFWRATDVLGGVASDPAGLTLLPSSVAAAEAATGGLFEVSFLPSINWSPTYLARIAADAHGDLDPTPAELAASSQRNCILYVQMANSRRRSSDLNRTSFMYTLDRLGYADNYDVYDVQGFGNTNNHLAGRATVDQAAGYALIVQDSGRRRTAQLPDGSDLDSEKIDQAAWYEAWLASGAVSPIGIHTLWLMGENLAWHNRTKPLVVTTCGVSAVAESQSLNINPGVSGVAAFTWSNGNTSTFTGDAFVLEGDCPTTRDFDALGGTGVVTHRYRVGATTGEGAIVMNKSVAARWNTILSAFAWFDVRDAGAPSPLGPELTLANRILQGTLPIGCRQALDPSDIPSEDLASLPRVTRLHQNHPNPFNPTTEIRFDLVHEGEARLFVYDVVGRLVKRLAQSEYSRGSHAVTWDGTDEQGRLVASGAYWYRLMAGDIVATRRMILLK